MVAVINVNVNPFLAFSDLTYDLMDTRIGKNNGVALVSCPVWKCVLSAILSGVFISLSVICYGCQMGSQ